MSASGQRASDLRRGTSVLPGWVKQAVRAALRPAVGLAQALHLTPNGITVIGLLITLVAAGLVAAGWLVPGALVLTGGSLLDAVDGALARASGGGTRFGAFLDSTLDRASEAIVYGGIAGYYLLTASSAGWPVLLAFLALTGSFLVSYARARAEGIGVDAEVGLAPRTERLVIVIAGIGLAGLGLGWALIAALAAVALLTTVTTVQRIWHVWRLSQRASATPTEET